MLHITMLTSKEVNEAIAQKAEEGNKTGGKIDRGEGEKLEGKITAFPKSRTLRLTLEAV